MNARVVQGQSEDAEGPRYRTTRYTVYPTGYARVAVPERSRWCIRVEVAEDGWAIRWRNQCLNYRNTWEPEPPPKARSFDFLDRCRFSEQAAINRARWAVDRLMVDQMTFDDFVTHVQAEATAKARKVLADASLPSDGANKGLAFTRLGSRLLSTLTSSPADNECEEPLPASRTRIAEQLASPGKDGKVNPPRERRHAGRRFYTAPGPW